jgi:uncharacterized protein YjbJ (UPF0337 family)
VDELMAILTDKVGLTPEQAKGALGGVMGFMKDKLPADVFDQIGSIPGVGDFMDSLGDVTGAAGEAVAGAAGAATGAAAGAAGAATDAAAGAAETATSTAGSIIDSVKGLFGKS